VLLVIAGIAFFTRDSAAHPELTVRANDNIGASYTNASNKPEKIEFEATGKWLAIPSDNTDTGVPRTAKGYISPDGDPNFIKSNVTPCRAPVGALIVIKDDKCLTAYGKQGSFYLDPGETVRFLMNDVEGMYNDNQGSIDVYISIK
jgi:hypothetical protein